jgi:hypothetical protein
MRVLEAGDSPLVEGALVLVPIMFRLIEVVIGHPFGSRGWFVRN